MDQAQQSDRRRRLVGFYALALLLTVASTDALPLPALQSVVVASAEETQEPGAADAVVQVSISLDGDLVEDVRARIERVAEAARATIALARKIAQAAAALAG